MNRKLSPQGTVPQAECGFVLVAVTVALVLVASIALLLTTESAVEAELTGRGTEALQADYLAQFAGLESGDLDVAMEMWETTGKDAMEASLATGKTEVC